MPYRFTTNIEIPMQIDDLDQSTIDRLISELQRRQADLVEQSLKFLTVTFRDTPEAKADHCVAVCRDAYATVTA